MDNNNQNQPQNQIQFNSEKITELKDKRNQEVQAKFRTRLTVRDRLQKLGAKPFLQGTRKFIWLGAVVLIAVGVTVGIVLVNRSGDDSDVAGGEFSEEWYEELDWEIYDAMENMEVVGAIEKVDAAIARARELDNDEVLQRLYPEKVRMQQAMMDYDEVLATYEAMKDDLGESPSIYRQIGQLYIDTKNYAAALENYKKALELMPEDDEEYGNVESTITTLEGICG